MGDTLSSLFRDHFRTHFLQDALSDELNRYIHGKRIEKKAVQTFLNPCLKEPTSTDERIAQLETFISICLFAHPFCMSYEEILLPHSKTLLAETVYDENTLVQAQKTLICLLLEIPHEPYLFDSEKIPEKRVFLEENRFPAPLQNAKAALLLNIISHLTKDEKLKKQSTDFSFWHLSLLDHNLNPFSGLWSQESDFDDEMLTMTFFLIFYSSFHLGRHKIFENTLPHLMRRLRKKVETKTKTPVFLILLNQFIDHIKNPALIYFDESRLPTQNILDPNLALLSKKTEDFSAIFSLHGIGTGLGSIHTKGIEIKTFGPQFFPLDGSKGFGIYRPKGKNPSQDLTVSENALKGWSRLCTKKQNRFEPHPIWMHTETKLSEKNVEIKLDFHGLEEEENLALSFYLNAEFIERNGNRIYPKKLDHFEGPSEKILVHGKEGSLLLDVNGTRKMHIIPLAGEGCYWNADFLIAYSIDKNPLTLSLST